MTSRPPDARNLSRTSLRPADPIRWGIGHALASYAVGLLLSTLLFSVAGGDADAPTTTTVAYLAAVTGLWIGFVGGPIAATHWLGSGSLRNDFGLRIRATDIPLGVLAGIVTQLVIVPIISWPVELLTDADIDEPTRQLLDTTTGGRWLLFAIIVVGAPITEELFFRGFLLRAIARRFVDPAAISASAGLFAVSHYQLAQTPGLFTVGIVFAVLARRAGRLGPAIVAHMAFNTTALLLAT